MSSSPSILKYSLSTLLFLVIFQQTSIAVTTAGVLQGRVVAEDGAPVGDVQVCLYRSTFRSPAFQKASPFPDHALICEMTSADGYYRFEPEHSDTYSIIGKKGHLWFFRNGIKLSTMHLSDTLKESGSLHFFTQQENSSNHKNISVCLQGTPFSITSDTKGSVFLKKIPPGTYVAFIYSSLKGYHAVRCSLRITPGLEKTFSDTIRLPYVGIQKISDLRATLDTLQHTIRLSWINPDTTIDEVHIFRRTGNQKTFATTPYSTVTGKVFNDLIDYSQFKTSLRGTSHMRYSYYLVNLMTGAFSDTVTIDLPGKPLQTVSDKQEPEEKTPQKDIHRAHEMPKADIRISAGQDTVVGPQKRVHLRGRILQGDPGDIATWEWSIDRSPFREAAAAETTFIPPPVAATHVCVLRATDTRSNTWYDTVVVQVKTSAPVVYARSAPTAGLFQKIVLHGSATNTATIHSRGWDIGNTGSFTIVETEDIKAGPVRFPRNPLLCIFRVINTDGEAGYDTLRMEIGPFWDHMRGFENIPDRKSHSLICHKDALWIIGGTRSDIWHSRDVNDWINVTDSAPFGNRYGHAAVSFRDKLWVIGGKTGDTFPGDIWSSPDGIRWNLECDAPFLKRHYHTAVVFHDKTWVIGGLSDAGSGPLNDIWVSADLVTWEQVTEHAPFSPRYGHGAAVFNNVLLVAGGLYDGIDGSKTVTDVWSSANGTNWERCAESVDFPPDRFMTFLTYDDRLWALGGYCSGASGDSVFSDILYTSDSREWTRITKKSTNSDKYYVAGAVFNDKIILSPSGSNKLWMLK